MQFLDLVKKRRSVRRFRPEPVPSEMIEACVEAARYAPTACNRQGWRFIVSIGERKERLVREALGGAVVPNRWASSAPVIVAVAMNLDLVVHRIGGRIKGTGYHVIDAGIAGEHFVLQATELGLGTCWIGWFDKRAAKRILRLSPRWDLPALIAVGFPDEEPAERKRRRTADILSEI
jgi:nitroreductase